MAIATQPPKASRPGSGDADNHSYEARHCFTRHMARTMIATTKSGRRGDSVA